MYILENIYTKFAYVYKNFAYIYIKKPKKLKKYIRIEKNRAKKNRRKNRTNQKNERARKKETEKKKKTAPPPAPLLRARHVSSHAGEEARDRSPISVLRGCCPVQEGVGLIHGVPDQGATREGTV
jgi:hypothetical protein